MKRLWTVLVLIVGLCVAMPATASAERATWKDKNVDFSTIQTVTVPDDAAWQAGTHPSDIDILKVRNRIDDTTTKALSNYKVTMLPVAAAQDQKNIEAFTQEATESAAADNAGVTAPKTAVNTGANSTATATTKVASPKALPKVDTSVSPITDADVAKTEATLGSADKTAAPADAHVHINITNWQYRQYWVEPQLYTTYRTMVHYDRWGHAYYWTVPVERVEPGYYVTVAYMTAHFTVTDASGHVIYETIDSRSADKDPVDMFGHALSQFYSEFNSVGKHK